MTFHSDCQDSFSTVELVNYIAVGLVYYNLLVVDVATTVLVTYITGIGGLIHIASYDSVVAVQLVNIVKSPDLSC